MKKEILAICDEEAGYAYRLMDYLNRKPGMPFEVHAFTSRESLIAFMKSQKVQVLLINPEMGSAEELKPEPEQLLYLSEGKRRLDQPVVYKYQSSDDIAGEVLENYAACHEETGGYGGYKKEYQTVGIYSPVGRCGKTTFAIIQGQILASTHATLYLNLEACPGLGRWLSVKGKRNLMDIMASGDPGNGDFALRLQAAVLTEGQLDYVIPADYPADFRNAGPEDWKLLFARIREETIYEKLILDIGLQIPVEVLEECNRIYMPYLEEEYHKIEQFYHILEILNKAYLKERIVPVKIPYYSDEKELEQKRWGKTGRFIQTLIWEE